MSGAILVSCSRIEAAGACVEALKACGVAADDVHLLPPEPGLPYRQLAAQAAGVVLAGGGDPHPRLWGELPADGANLQLGPERDALEQELFAGARAARVPVWGVCRGMQMINVLLGGSLWQDLPSQRPDCLPHNPPGAHDALAHALVVTRREAPIGRLLSDPAPRVNSRHHQAVKRLAPGLTAVAESPDGVVEALWLDDPAWWLRGVQWHPEDLLALPAQRALWQEFVDAAGASGAEA